MKDDGYKNGDSEIIIKNLLEALAINREHGNTEGEAEKLCLIGNAYRARGDSENALRYLEDAKKIFERLGATPQLKIVQNAIDGVAGKR